MCGVLSAKVRSATVLVLVVAAVATVLMHDGRRHFQRSAGEGSMVGGGSIVVAAPDLIVECWCRWQLSCGGNVSVG